MLKILLTILLIPLSLSGITLPPLTAPSYVVMDAKTGTILAEKNSEEKRSPASILKIATCIYTLEKCRDELDTPITASQDSIGAVAEEEKEKANYTQPAHWLVFGASHMGIKKGEVLTLRDLLYGMMVVSADDASNVIAEYAGRGSIPRFMEELNTYVKNLGCHHTTFKNPHGLYHPEQRTTAKDMAKIAYTAYKDPLFRTICKTVTCTRPKTNKQEPTTLAQTNKLLRKGNWFYAPATGIKTGKIQHSGYCLVASAEKNERALLVVLMGCKEREKTWEEAKALFEAFFQEEKKQTVLLPKGLQDFVLEHPKMQTIETFLADDLIHSYYPSQEEPVSLALLLHELEPPLAHGERVATVQVKQHGSVLQEAPLFYKEPEEVKKPFWHIFEIQWDWRLILGFVLLVIFILGAFRLTS